MFPLRTSFFRVKIPRKSLKRGEFAWILGTAPGKRSEIFVKNQQIILPYVFLPMGDTVFADFSLGGTLCPER